MQKLKNPILISSILSTILLILSSLGIINIENDTINTIVNSILSILSLLGIISVPKISIETTKNNDKNDT